MPLSSGVVDVFNFNNGETIEDSSFEIMFHVPAPRSRRRNIDHPRAEMSRRFRTIPDWIALAQPQVPPPVNPANNNHSDSTDIISDSPDSPDPEEVIEVDDEQVVDDFLELLAVDYVNLQ